MLINKYLFTIIICVLSSMAIAASEIKAKGLELYSPLYPNTAAVDDAGNVFVLDRDTEKILSFDAQGNPRKTFAGRGQGPGELSFSFALHFTAGKLAVNANTVKLHWFSPDGVFLGRGGSEQGLMFLMADGALLVEHSYRFDNQKTPAHIYWYPPDIDREKRVELTSFRRLPKEAFNTSYSEDGKIISHINPAQDRSKVVVTRDGKMAFVYHSGSKNILIINSSNPQKMNEIKLPKPPEFNEFWGNIKIEERSKKRSPSVKQIPYMPDYFPACRMLKIVNDTLYVVLWSGTAPSKEFPVIAFNRSGQSVKAQIDAKSLHQIVGTYKDTAWVTTWDAEQEEAGLVRVPMDQVAEVVAAKPLD